MFMNEKRRNTATIVAIRTALLWLLPTIVVLLIVTDHIRNTSAADTVKFSQTISPGTPVQSTGDIKPMDTNLGSVQNEFVMAQPIDGSTTDAKPLGMVSNPVVTFRGTVTHPNVEVLLKFSSAPFFVNVTSDAFGEWNWTSYTHPFEDGNHEVYVYSFVPGAQSGVMEVFAERYRFAVKDSGGRQPAALGLKGGAVNCGTTQQCLDGRLAADSAGSLYLLNVSLENGRTSYTAGQNIGLQLSFKPMMVGRSSSADIKYEIYYQEAAGLVQGPLAIYYDQLPLGAEQTFLKAFKLNDQVATGQYLIKVTVQIGQDTYIENVSFTVVGMQYATFGGGIVSGRDYDRTILWNVIFVLVIICGILIVAALEIRRFFVYKPIDEKLLHRQGFF